MADTSPPADVETRPDVEHQREIRTNPDGPAGLPLIGSVREFASDPLEFVTQTARLYGPVANYRLGTYDVYQIDDPELIQHVLVDHNDRYVKGELFDRTLEPVLGRGLLTSEGEFWREHRHRLQPAFHPDQIASAGAVMTDYTQRLTDGWTAGERRNVHEDMMQLTVEIVARALFDVDIRDAEGDIGRALTVVMDTVSNRMGYPVEVPLWLPTPGNRRYRQAIEALQSVAERIVAEHERGPEQDEGDVVSLLLDGPDGGLSREQARDEIVTLLLAGHETTALSLTYAFHALGRNPEVERRLHDELDDVLGGRPPTIDDLTDLTYTEQVVTETMRLYPPVCELAREPVTDDVVGGYEIPAGSTVLFHQWVQHRDPRFYDDPLAFRPGRWGSETRSVSENASGERSDPRANDLERELPNYAYFPFGGGPRRCIGDRFAMLEARLVLATIAQEWTFDPLAELSFAPSITLRPDGPVEMVTRRR